MATVEGLIGFDFSQLTGYALDSSDSTSPKDFDQHAQTVVKRTRVMNAFLAFFYTQEILTANYGRERMVITPDLTIPMDSLNPDAGMGFGNQRVTHLSMSRFPSTYTSGLPYPMDGRLQMRGAPIPRDVVKNAGQDLSALMANHGDEGVLLVDLFLRGSKAFQDHDNSLSLINNWTVVERLLNDLWHKLREDHKTRDGATFINGDRMKRLQDGRTFTASVMSEMLSFLNYLPKDIYDDMVKIRKTRNEWMHGLKVVDVQTAELAISVTERMLEQVKDVTIKGATGRRLHG